MLALRAAAAPPYVEMVAAPEPEPLPHEALVRVHATSLNRGEVLDLETAGEGAPVGWDLAGVVDRAAADRSGPPAGARVSGLVRRGAWAELVAVPTAQLAVMPAGVSDSEAAALPTAGLTALRALELGGLLLGRRVLVTGATGGVGQYAVQLAALAGAAVTALARDRAATAELQQLGAVEVVDAVHGSFDMVVDGVGGSAFTDAIEHVAPRGLVVNLATGSADEVVSFRAAKLDQAAGARIYTFNLRDELNRVSAREDLERLASLVAARKLVAPIGLEATWWEIDDAIEALLARRLHGKVVLHLKTDDPARTRPS
jgi:NADPH2:quinone reductase